MKVKLTLVCDIDMPRVQNVPAYHVGQTAQEFAERALHAAFAKAGFSVKSTVTVLDDTGKETP